MTSASAAELHTAGTPGPQLLLVEDEESIGSLVRAYLEQTGYRVAWVRSGEEALQSLETVRPRLVILDIGLPGADGFDICRGIRARSDVPVLMLTARDEEADRVAGLEVGADDYVSKPFSPRELAARVKAVLRRTGPTTRVELLELGDVAVDPGAREVRVAGGVVDPVPQLRDGHRLQAGVPGAVAGQLAQHGVDDPLIGRGERDPLLPHMLGPDQTAD